MRPLAPTNKNDITTTITLSHTTGCQYGFRCAPTVALARHDLSLESQAYKTWKHARTWSCFVISKAKDARCIVQRIDLEAASSEMSAGKMSGYERGFGASLGS